jgi:hypothetical protein
MNEITYPTIGFKVYTDNTPWYDLLPMEVMNDEIAKMD